MENNIYHLSTGVKNITVVGLPEGANNLAMIHDNTRPSWVNKWGGFSRTGSNGNPDLPPGSYTLIGTLNEMSEEQAAELLGREASSRIRKTETFVGMFCALLSSHGLLNKYPNVAILEKIN